LQQCSPRIAEAATATAAARSALWVGKQRGGGVSILWIILIIVLVLVVLGFFGRGRL
jgi:flagellar basal body-associated protein FliL